MIKSEKPDSCDECRYSFCDKQDNPRSGAGLKSCRVLGRRVLTSSGSGIDKDCPLKDAVYDFLGERMCTPVLEAGIDSDEISDVINYSKQSRILNRRRKALAKKAAAADVESRKSSSLETIVCKNIGELYIIEGSPYTIRMDTHGPERGQPYAHFHVVETERDERSDDLNVCGVVKFDDSRGIDVVYFEPHGDNPKNGTKNINKIIGTESEVKIRDVVAFLFLEIPKNQRQCPKMKKAIALDTVTPKKYSPEMK